jgi:hypothetical protein
MERLVESGYQICVLDPEGDYQSFPKSVVMGDARSEPPVDQVLDAMKLPYESVIANLVGVPFERRPDYFERISPRVSDMQAKSGRPHWLVADEAHHVAPADRDNFALPPLCGVMAITLDPTHLSAPLLKTIDVVIAVGDAPLKTITDFAKSVGSRHPAGEEKPLEKGKAMLWLRSDPESITIFDVAEAHTPRTRHSRKYAEAMLPPDRSFYFRGPQGKLNLRAPNLITFVQMMEGVDDETLLFHLRKHEYSKWFREAIKNNDLAEEAERIENSGMPAAEVREALKRMIEERYTLPE